MNKIKFVSLLAGLGLMLAQTPSFAGVTLAQPTGANQYVQGEVLVKFKPGVAAAMHTEIARNYGAQAVQTLANLPSIVVARLMPGQSVEQAVSAYASDPNVEYAQPNYIYHALATPVPTLDPQYGKLWAAKNTGQTISPFSYAINNPPPTSGNDMNLELAWDVQTDCSAVVVAVVDTGVNYNSLDLVNNMWSASPHGQNFATDRPTGTGSDPMDLNGHGTHVAGIIGAEGGNGIGGAGVCWKANIMAVRVLDAFGTGYSTTIAAGLNYAVANGAKVINMSLGGSGFDPTFSAAITAAQTAGVLLVVAAGNEANNNDVTSARYPCNYTQANLICVAALDQNYALADFSNWGATSVDVGAPGTNIYSTWAGANATITEFYTAPGTGWFNFTTTAGGFVYGSASTPYGLFNSLNNPGTWPTGTYTANTTDHAWKNFDLSGTATAMLDIYGAFHVPSDGSGAVAQSSTGGDPFAVAAPAYLWGPYYTDLTPVTTPTYRFFPTIDLKNCRTAACTIGFEMKTGATLDLGVSIAYFQINTLTLNNTSYNTIDGTSMATPEVAGVAALVWAHNPLYTYADVAAAIKNGGRAVTALSGKSTTGKAVDGMGSLSYINPPSGIAVTVQ